MTILIMLVMMSSGGVFMGLPKVLSKVHIKTNYEAVSMFQTVGLFLLLIGGVGLLCSLSK